MSRQPPNERLDRPDPEQPVTEEVLARGFEGAVERAIERAHRDGRSTSPVIDGLLVRVYPTVVARSSARSGGADSGAAGSGFVPVVGPNASATATAVEESNRGAPRADR